MSVTRNLVYRHTSMPSGLGEPLDDVGFQSLIPTMASLCDWPMVPWSGYLAFQWLERGMTRLPQCPCKMRETPQAGTPVCGLLGASHPHAMAGASVAIACRYAGSYTDNNFTHMLMSLVSCITYMECTRNTSTAIAEVTSAPQNA